MSLIDRGYPGCGRLRGILGGGRAAYPRQEPLLNLNNAAALRPARSSRGVIDAYRLVSRNPHVNMWSSRARPADRLLRKARRQQFLALPLLAGDQVLISPLGNYASVCAGWLQRQSARASSPSPANSVSSMTTKRSSPPIPARSRRPPAAGGSPVRPGACMASSPWSTARSASPRCRCGRRPIRGRRPRDQPTVT